MKYSSVDNSGEWISGSFLTQLCFFVFSPGNINRNTGTLYWSVKGIEAETCNNLNPFIRVIFTSDSYFSPDTIIFH